MKTLHAAWLTDFTDGPSGFIRPAPSHTHWLSGV